MKNVLLILFSVSLNALAQLFIRQGMLQIGKVSLRLDQLWHMAVESMSNGYLISAIFCYIISFVTWMIVLSRVNVSLACPFLSVGYIITAVLAYFTLNEPLTLQKMVGIVVICLGVIVLTYSKDSTL